MNPITIILFAALGWLLGALVNYLSDVLPETRRFTPALCPKCRARWSLIDYLLMVPCRACGKRRGVRAWVVQIAFVAMAAGSALYPPERTGTWATLALLVFFGVVAVIDIEHRIIMHPVSMVGAVLGGAVGIWLHGWLPTLIGGVAGFGIMFALYYLGALLARWIGRLRKQEIDEEALGFGDVTLSGVLGLLLGWPGIVAGLIYAVLLGGLVSLIVIAYQFAVRRYQAFQAIPYGPFLLIAAVILLFLQ